MHSDLAYDCSLEWIGRAEKTSHVGAATIVDTGEYCTSHIGHVLQVFYLGQMKQDGFMEEAFQDYLNSVSTIRCPEVTTQIQILTRLTDSRWQIWYVFICATFLMKSSH
jgi:hypothetical protein